MLVGTFGGGIISGLVSKPWTGVIPGKGIHGDELGLVGLQKVIHGRINRY